MPTAVGSIAEAIVVARDTLDKAPPDSQSGRVSIVPTLREYAERCTSLKVQIRSGLLNIDHTRGLVLRYSDRVIVSIGAELNTCWTRFVVCKELMHLLVDVEPHSFTTDIVHQLSCMVVGSQIRYRQVDSEMYPFFAALEYMLPHNFRPQKSDGVHTTLAIAKRFMVPHAFVEFFYSEEGQKLMTI